MFRLLANWITFTAFMAQVFLAPLIPSVAYAASTVKPNPSPSVSGLVVDPKKPSPSPSPSAKVCPLVSTYIDKDGDHYYSATESIRYCSGEFPENHYPFDSNKKYPLGKDCLDDKTLDPDGTKVKEYKINAEDNNGDGRYQKIAVKTICAGESLEPKYALVDWNLPYNVENYLQSKEADSKAAVSKPKFNTINCPFVTVYEDRDGDRYYTKRYSRKSCVEADLPENTYYENGTHGQSKGVDCNDDPAKNGVNEFKEYDYNAIDENGDWRYRKAIRTPPFRACSGETLHPKYAMIRWNLPTESEKYLQSEELDKKVAAKTPKGLNPINCHLKSVYVDQDNDGYYAEIKSIPSCSQDDLPTGTFYRPNDGSLPKGKDCNDKDEHQQKLHTYNAVDANNDGKFRKRLGTEPTQVCSSEILNPKYAVIDFNLPANASLVQSKLADDTPATKPLTQYNTINCPRKNCFIDMDGDKYYAALVSIKSCAESDLPAGTYYVDGPHGPVQQKDCNDTLPDGAKVYKSLPYNAVDLDNDGKFHIVDTKKGVLQECVNKQGVNVLGIKYAMLNSAFPADRSIIESEAQDKPITITATPTIASPTSTPSNLPTLALPSNTPSISVSPKPSTPVIVGPSVTPSSVTPSFSPSITPSADSKNELSLEDVLNKIFTPTPSAIPSTLIPPSQIGEFEFPGHVSMGTTLPAIQPKSTPIPSPSPSPTNLSGTPDGWGTHVSSEAVEKLWVAGHNSEWKSREELIKYQNRLDALDWFVHFFHGLYQAKAAQYIEAKFGDEQIKLWFDYTRFRTYHFKDAPEYESHASSIYLNESAVSGEDTLLGIVRYATYKTYKISLFNPSSLGLCLTYSNFSHLMKGGAVSESDPAFLGPGKEMLVEFFDKTGELDQPGTAISLGFGSCDRDSKNVVSHRLFSFKIKNGQGASIAGSCPANSSLSTGKCGTLSCNCQPGFHFESLAQQIAARNGQPDPFAGKNMGSEESCGDSMFDLLQNRALGGSKYKDLRIAGDPITDLHCVEDLCKLADQTIFVDATMTKCAICQPGSAPNSDRSSCVPQSVPPARPAETSCLEEVGVWPNNGWIPTDRMMVPDGAGGCKVPQCSNDFIRTNTKIIWGVREGLKDIFRGTDYYDELRRENRVFIFNKDKLCDCPKETHYIKASVPANVTSISSKDAWKYMRCKAKLNCNPSSEYAGTYFFSEKTEKCEKTCPQPHTQFEPNPDPALRCKCEQGYGNRWPGPGESCERKDDFACEDKSKFPDYETPGWPCTIDRCPAHAEWVGGNDGGCECRTGWHTEDGIGCVNSDDSAENHWKNTGNLFAKRVHSIVDQLLPEARAEVNPWNANDQGEIPANSGRPADAENPENPSNPVTPPGPDQNSLADWGCDLTNNWLWYCGENGEPPVDPSPTPSADVTEEPTAEPTTEPTVEPSTDPTPTETPTAEPTENPTWTPSPEPSPSNTESPTRRKRVAANKTKQPKANVKASSPGPNENKGGSGPGFDQDEYSTGVPTYPRSGGTHSADTRPKTGQDLGSSISLGQSSSSVNGDGPALSESDSEFVAKMKALENRKNFFDQHAPEAERQLSDLRDRIIQNAANLKAALQLKQSLTVDTGYTYVNWVTGLEAYNTIAAEIALKDIPKLREKMLEDLAKYQEFVQNSWLIPSEARPQLIQQFIALNKAVNKIGADTSDAWEKSEQDLTTLVEATQISINITAVALSAGATGGTSLLLNGAKLYHGMKLSQYALFAAKDVIKSYDPDENAKKGWTERFKDEHRNTFVDKCESIEKNALLMALAGMGITGLAPGAASAPTIFTKVREGLAAMISAGLITAQAVGLAEKSANLALEIIDYVQNGDDMTEAEKLAKKKSIADLAVEGAFDLVDLAQVAVVIARSHPNGELPKGVRERLVEISQLQQSTLGSEFKKGGRNPIDLSIPRTVPDSFILSPNKNIAIDDLKMLEPKVVRRILIKDQEKYRDTNFAELSPGKFIRDIHARYKAATSGQSSERLDTLFDYLLKNVDPSTAKINLFVRTQPDGSPDITVGYVIAAETPTGQVELNIDANWLLKASPEDFLRHMIHEFDHLHRNVRLRLASEVIKDLNYFEPAKKIEFDRYVEKFRQDYGESPKFDDALFNAFMNTKASPAAKEYFAAWKELEAANADVSDRQRSEKLALEAERALRGALGLSDFPTLREFLYPEFQGIRTILSSGKPLSELTALIYSTMYNLQTRYFLMRQTNGFSNGQRLPDYMENTLSTYLNQLGMEKEFTAEEINFLTREWLKSANLSQLTLDRLAPEDFPWSMLGE